MAYQRSPADKPTNTDLFSPLLEHMLDMSHELVKLSHVMPWDTMLHNMRDALPAIPAGGGQRPLPARLMIGLLYLKYAYDLSDEAVCQRWLENPYFQYFCGEVTFQISLPCDPSSLTRYRHRLDEAGIEEMLAQTIEAAKQLKAVKPSDLKRIIVDTTVQEKAIAYPTDSRLLEVARKKLVEGARQQGIVLRQSYARKGPQLALMAGRYAHAKQFKRMRRCIKKQRTIVGRLIRDIQRKAPAEVLIQLQDILQKAERLRLQEPKSKHKLYAWHAPEVECISKGKARQPYEFGVKVGIAVSATKGLVLGARSFPGNPYDGDTLAEQCEQAGILSDIVPEQVLVDLGYRGREVEHTRILHKGKRKSLTPSERRWLKRRSAIEPAIGHLKDDHRMRRNFLKGAQGDALNAVLAAAGYNIRWLMRWLLAFWPQFRAVFLALLERNPENKLLIAA